MKLDSCTFDEMLAKQDPFDGSDPIVDLREVEFVSSAALVQLAAAAYAVADQGGRATFLFNDDGVRTYVMRAGFDSAVLDVADVEPAIDSRPYRRLKGSNRLLLEVRRIDDSSVLPSLLDKVLSVLLHDLQYKKYDAFDIVTIISEITQNTFDHNSDTSGFIAMQVYSPKKPFLEIGIADHGLGLRKTLCKNPKNGIISTDEDAIRRAIELGTSEHDDPTRGTGLYHLVDTTYKHEGSVQIRTGNAKVRYRMDKKQGWMFPVPYMVGVQVALTLPSKQ